MLVQKRAVTPSIVSQVFDLYNRSIMEETYIVLSNNIVTIDDLQAFAYELKTQQEFTALCIAHEAPLLADRNFLCFKNDNETLLISRPCHRSVFVYYTTNPEILKQLIEQPIERTLKIISSLFMPDKRLKSSKKKGNENNVLSTNIIDDAILDNE